MTQALSAEEKARLKKQWTELAIQQALASQWQEAVVTNKNILNLFPNEAEAYNRLGKAYRELGMYAEAREAYSQTLKLNPNNTIARKNLEQLALIQEDQARVNAATVAIDPVIFNEEPGKRTTTDLLNLAEPQVLARVSTGEKVQLERDGHAIYVHSATGERIGQIEPRLANRLITLMEHGNRYEAAISTLDNNHVRVVISESYQHPSMVGTVSFPAQAGGELVRPYTKDSMLRYDRDEEDELLSEDEYYEGTEDSDEYGDLDFESGSDVEE
ncbi:tetratricopeptide repeat protein [Thermogemmatispora carboxidivorans]|uniref:tetratricopeptide repeat protein n=1 Tax=Thermogemmatispora carboxidivorans TaxID=1382306 RepID=UPI00069A03F9|nr:tetratricopeptide repeat protein [Thermogemmatispora carboxidivorans]